LGVPPNFVMEQLIFIIGAFGTFFIVLAHFLLATKKLTSESIFYWLLLILGAGLYLIQLGYNQVWNGVIFELIFITISVIGILKIKKQPKENLNG